MKKVVVDSSFAMAWCFEDEATPRTESLLNQVDQLEVIVPPLWRWEITNVLLMAGKRGRITAEQVSEYLLRLSRLSIQTDDDWAAVSLQGLADLARRHKLTAYDAAYLELAIRHEADLATLDQPLEIAARASGVAVV